MRTFTIAVLLALALLAGCSTVPSQPPVPRTPAESWFTTLAAYDAALAAASEYRLDCARRPPLRQSRCMETVLELRRLNREALQWKELGDMAFAEGDGAFLEQAVERMERLRERLEDEVAADIDGDLGGDISSGGAS